MKKRGVGGGQEWVEKKVQRVEEERVVGLLFVCLLGANVPATC